MSRVIHGHEARPSILGRTIFDYADDLAVAVPTSCRRNGICHECVVEIAEGAEALAPRTEAEGFLRGDYRLACQARIADAGIDIRFAPLRRRPRILTLSRPKKAIPLDPVVRRRGDEVLYDGEAVDRYRDTLLGLAIDLGTTTVVMDLVDLESGASLATCSFENPQRFGGSDVMHRISYDGEVGGGELQKAVVAAVNHEILELARDRGVRRRQIFEVVVAGNSTMRDLFFGLDVQGIGQRPYKSLVEMEWRAGKRQGTELNVGARELGIRVHPRARVYGLPLIASHVGADTAADLAALDLLEGGGDEVTMLVDIGTNTEVVVAGRGRMLAASCPAGPAFEGGLVTYGMAAYDGAIERLRLGADAHAESYETIGNVPPQGLCGSALVDALAELRRLQLMTAKGVFTADRKLAAVTLVPEHGITFSKQDIGNLGQAKAANYCGQYILLRAFGIDPAEVSRLYLAGGFANYLDVENAAAIGLLAPVPVERVVKVGNAAIQGAREVLLSASKRRTLEHAVRGIEHFELETTPDFFELFVDGCQFKPMPARLPKAPAAAPALQA